MYKISTFTISLILLLGTLNLSAQYTINDLFSDPNETVNITEDIFAVWWDNDMDYTTEAQQTLTWMIEFKETILNDYGLQVPQSTIDGHYINVYVHSDGGYYDIFNWGNGVGTDSNGYPYFTMPYAVINDRINTAHETFHIFQHNLNSPGFWYEGDKNWFTEASANWFAYLQNPNEPRSFVTAEILARLPHVPLWTGWFNRPVSYPQNWQRENHQYALGQFLFYLSEEANIPKDMLVSGYYANTNQVPQEYLFNIIGGDNFRNHFIDWAGLIVDDFDFDFMSQTQKQTSLSEWFLYADLADNNEYVETFNNTGTNGWYRPEGPKTTTGWSFNTYKLTNPTTGFYNFELNGDENGSYNDPSFFLGKVIVKNTDGTSFSYDLQMTDEFQGALSIEVLDDANEIYFIVASLPEIFVDVNPDFQQYSYEIRISNTLTSTADIDLSNQINIYPNPVENMLNINLGNNINEAQIDLYDCLGRKVFSKTNLVANEIELDFSDKKSGVYFLSITHNDKSSIFKLIK